MFTFHSTVRGHLHVMNGFPCEDSSISLSAENGRYHIAIVADGHGSKSCFRSNFGSKVATEVALECLQQFAEATLASEEIEERFYKDLFSNPRYHQMTIRRLTDTILAGWHDRVLENYNNEPPTLEEMGESVDEYENEKNPSHIYGTTLIAALQLPGCIVLLQQGDGRCDVFYEDGSVNQPIPWDPRCVDTATTSLCDEDAAERFRSCVINLRETTVIACYVGCDGVEDAYRDTYESLGSSHMLMGGVHTFYKYLASQICQMSQIDFNSWLPVFLDKFSADGIFCKAGSGDDVSVSGIVDLDRIASFHERYVYDVKLYALEEALFWKEDELRSKTRKHGILQKRLNDAQLELDDAISKHHSFESSLEQMKLQREEFAQKVESAKAELEDYRQDAESATGQFEGRYVNRFASAMQRFIEEISMGYAQKKDAYSGLLERLLEYDDNIKHAEEALVQSTEHLSELEIKRDEASSAYEEYDSKYQAIETERRKLMDAISVLQEGN